MFALFDAIRFEQRFGVDVEELSVRLDVPLVEHAAGKSVEVTSLERVQIALADARRSCNRTEGDGLGFARFSETISECLHNCRYSARLG